MTAGQRQLRHLDYIEHMVDAAVQAMAYVDGLSEQEFSRDAKTAGRCRSQAHRHR